MRSFPAVLTRRGPSPAGPWPEEEGEEEEQEEKEEDETRAICRDMGIVDTNTRVAGRL